MIEKWTATSRWLPVLIPRHQLWDYKGTCENDQWNLEIDQTECRRSNAKSCGSMRIGKRLEVWENESDRQLSLRDQKGGNCLA